ncbi:MAG TPA: PIN domain nuclease [Chitinophagaceae bacterium]|nr:PIN domain nuclease [Chitinophagaceae bacterium]HML57336.1 PIN domain-containing protein [Ferruginibacter sp.]
MKYVFIDTNIIVDLIGDRKPFSKYAIEIFTLAESKSLKLFTSSHTLATTYYILKSVMHDKALREVMSSMLEYVTVISVTEDIIRKSFRSKYSDVEDAIQIYCASTIPKMNCIVTRNTKDFKNSEIRALAPDQLLSEL